MQRGQYPGELAGEVGQVARFVHALAVHVLDEQARAWHYRARLVRVIGAGDGQPGPVQQFQQPVLGHGGVRIGAEVGRPVLAQDQPQGAAIWPVDINAADLCRHAACQRPGAHHPPARAGLGYQGADLR